MTFNKKFSYLLENGELYLYTTKGVCAKVQIVWHKDYIDRNEYSTRMGTVVKMKIIDVIADSNGYITSCYNDNIVAVIDADFSDHFEFLDRVVWGETYG